jgi:hypothetical protein
MRESVQHFVSIYVAKGREKKFPYIVLCFLQDVTQLQYFINL